MKKKKAKSTGNSIIFDYDSIPKGKKVKTVPLVLNSYHTYFDTGMIDWDKDNSSKEAVAFLKFMGLNWLLPGKESK